MKLYEAQKVVGTDYVIYSGLGHPIEFSEPMAVNEDGTLNVWGQLPDTPKVGETLLAVDVEGFVFTEFEFVEVSRKPYTPVVFFNGKIKPVAKWVHKPNMERIALTGNDFADSAEDTDE